MSVTSFISHPASEIYSYAAALVRSGERRTAQFTVNVIERVRSLSKNYPDSKQFDSWICARVAHQFVQLRCECSCQHATYCIYHSRDANFVRNIQDHWRTVYYRFESLEVCELCEILPNVFEPGAEQLRNSLKKNRKSSKSFEF